MVETTGQVEIEPIPNNHPSAFQKSPSKLCLRKLEFSGETVTEEIITSGVGSHFNFGELVFPSIAFSFSLSCSCVLKWFPL